MKIGDRVTIPCLGESGIVTGWICSTLYTIKLSSGATIIANRWECCIVERANAWKRLCAYVIGILSR